MINPSDLSGKDIIGWFQVANSWTGGLMGVMFLSIIALVLFFSFRQMNSNRVSIAATTFIIAILSFLFRLIGIVENDVIVVCVILLMGGAALLINDR